MVKVNPTGLFRLGDRIGQLRAMLDEPKLKFADFLHPWIEFGGYLKVFLESQYILGVESHPDIARAFERSMHEARYITRVLVPQFNAQLDEDSTRVANLMDEGKPAKWGAIPDHMINDLSERLSAFETLLCSDLGSMGLPAAAACLRHDDAHGAGRAHVW